MAPSEITECSVTQGIACSYISSRSNCPVRIWVQSTSLRWCHTKNVPGNDNYPSECAEQSV